jgi:hypothetical protein
MNHSAIASPGCCRAMIQIRSFEGPSSPSTATLIGRPSRLSPTTSTRPRGDAATASRSWS